MSYNAQSVTITDLIDQYTLGGAYGTKREEVLN